MACEIEAMKEAATERPRCHESAIVNHPCAKTLEIRALAFVVRTRTQVSPFGPGAAASGDCRSCRRVTSATKQ
jgi:hypothetical protein